MTEQASTPDGSGTTQRAGLFDIRVIIGALIGIDGLVVTIMGLLASDADKAKAGGLNIDLWTGLAMLVAAALFVTWARLRPIVLPDQAESPEPSTH